MTARMVMPSRLLTGPKPHKYVKSDHTNVARTFEKFRRLQALQTAQQGKA